MSPMSCQRHMWWDWHQTKSEDVLHTPNSPGCKRGLIWKKILQNLRTQEDYLKAYYLLDTTKSEAEQKKICQETGINQASIWSLLLHFDMGQAIPGGYVHAICINLIQALVTLWHGEFKGLDAGTGHYIIPAEIWKAIGEVTHDSNHWVPAAFVRSLANINTNFRKFTAEASAFWLMYIAPHVLRDWLLEPYYLHVLNLVRITYENLYEIQHDPQGTHVALQRHIWVVSCIWRVSELVLHN